MTISHKKGAAYERKISKIFSERFADAVGKSKGFFRNVNSGAYFGASNQKRLETHLIENAQLGDIVAPRSFAFTIECKHYAHAINFAALVRQENAQFDRWIAQASQDAQNASRRMLIVVKFNNVPDFVICDDPTNAFAIYRGHSLVTLKDWLNHDDSYYFKN